MIESRTEILRRMSICCWCNGSGRCINCSCARSRNCCVECLSIRTVCCCNIYDHQDTQDTPGEALASQDLDYVEVILDSLEVPSSLPSFTAVQEPSLKWGEVDGATFTEVIDHAYAETVHWHRNLLKVPLGKGCKAFVLEMGRLFRAYAKNSPLEQIALKCMMTMPALLLQRPHRSAKTKKHSICLQRRLISWKQGDIDALLHEGCTI